MAFIVGIPLAVVLVGVGITMAVYARADDSDALTAPSADDASGVLEAEAVMVAELVEGMTSRTKAEVEHHVAYPRSEPFPRSRWSAWTLKFKPC